MFSVIIAAYNSENSIEKTLDNILFSLRNIESEIIVVDDGSTDNTLNILKNYKDIIVFHQKNNGVSSARNTGIKIMSKKSKFVTFIDDSDYVSSNFFEKSIEFFQKNQNIKLAVSPIIVIENNQKKNHFLNYRFNDNKKIVNIFRDYSYIHFHIGGVVFKSEIFSSNKNLFDENIHFWEDAKLFNNLILSYQKYGLMHDINYYYYRDNQNSLAKSAWNNKERYNDHIEKNFLSLINNSIKTYGKVIKYVQYLVIIHYLQFLFSHNFQYINVNYILENNQFLKQSQKLLSYIDKDIIDELKIDKRYKFFIYKLKGISIDNELNYINIYIHKFDIPKMALIFSFSEEAFDITDDSKVYIKNKRNCRQAKFIKKYEKDILHYISNDFSRNIFEVKLKFRELFYKNTFIIKNDENINIRIVDESFVTRVLNKIKIYIERKIKNAGKF